MKAKWYLGTFIFIFIFLGVVNHNQIPEANQEIVLQFTHLKVSANEAKNTIAILKKQLQAIGVDNIQVEEQVTGGLKITYYSNTDAASVKKILSEADVLTSENTTSQSNRIPLQLPSHKKTSNYNLDVFEISKKDVGTGFGGACALEIKADYNRFYIPVVSVPTKSNVVHSIEQSKKETYKFQRFMALAIDNTSHKIPEVRAGPKC